MVNAHDAKANLSARLGRRVPGGSTWRMLAGADRPSLLTMATGYVGAHADGHAEQ